MKTGMVSHGRGKRRHNWKRDGQAEGEIHLQSEQKRFKIEKTNMKERFQSEWEWKAEVVWLQGCCHPSHEGCDAHKYPLHKNAAASKCQLGLCNSEKLMNCRRATHSSLHTLHGLSFCPLCTQPLPTSISPDWEFWQIFCLSWWYRVAKTGQRGWGSRKTSTSNKADILRAREEDLQQVGNARTGAQGTAKKSWPKFCTALLKGLN